MARGGTAATACICLVCGTSDARPIVYGVPSGDLVDDPSIVLGGCMVTGDDPAFSCRNPSCGQTFGLGRR